MSLNLEKQLLFYGAYHHNAVNVGIHIACVPVIMLTFFVLLSNTPSVPLPPWLSIPNLPLNITTVGGVLYSTLYVLMEPVAGGLYAPIIIGGTAWANHLTATYGASANYWAGGINFVCWIAQFVGHGKFEKRAPALLDNLVQALFLAPFFVWFEILFFLGYRPDLKRRVDESVEQEIKKLNTK
ncbi:DUF962-domain-containing protein [Aaosphaeria arxii CBS 175.79]|uniref:DUF962-domain-containing protein n=1 Tax=Aaosphaeria arxii CBS 175.79 TaxID=1450172 RepID=A0A6A5XK84_9PLEO|nr:DUF962-domain-containing protein [Aaosphaeria arxii CBS 175.79]KAF2013227.1 DUF962-domain-containing protein [Aaosphaeria arxii CBS 175.79]